MSCLGIHITQIIEKEQKTYWVKEVAPQVLKAYGEKVVLEWYDNPERKGTPVVNIPCPELGRKYMVSCRGSCKHVSGGDDYAHLQVRDRADSPMHGLVSSSTDAGGFYDFSYYRYTFDEPESVSLSLLGQRAGARAYISKAVVVVERL